MQTPANPQLAAWLTWLVQPAVILAGTGLFVRLVLWPAFKNLMRTELKAELDRLAEHHDQIRDVQQQTAAHAEALAALIELPIMLARIEANVETLMERRRQAREPV